MTSIMSFTAAGALSVESKPKSLFEGFAGTEAELIAASEGQVERRGEELIVWRNGPQHDRGMIFRNWHEPGGEGHDADGAAFRYLGKSDRYYLVLQSVEHDAPFLHLIDRIGRDQMFFSTNEDTFATKSDQHLVSVRTSSVAKGTPLLTIRGLHFERQGAGMIFDRGYEEELRCDAPTDDGVRRKEGFYGDLLALSDNEIRMEVKGEIWPDSRTQRNRTLGTLRVVREGPTWSISEPKDLWEGFACH
jgi:hypothetical protein